MTLALLGPWLTHQDARTCDSLVTQDAQLQCWLDHYPGESP